MILKDIMPILKLLKNFSKKIFFVKIEGLSCFPEILPEKIYLVLNVKPKIGDFIVFKGEREIFVKKLKKIKDNFLILEDSFKKEYKIEREKVLGKIVLKIT